MAKMRKIEVYSAGCVACTEVVEMVRAAGCASDEVIVNDMNDGNIAKRAKSLGIRSVPAVVIDGKLATCCACRSVDIEMLKGAYERLCKVTLTIRKVARLSNVTPAPARQSFACIRRG
jgi:glutaredoxin 3